MHINSQTGVSVVRISRSCLARYLDAADHIVAAGASLDRKSMVGRMTLDFMSLPGCDEKSPRSNGARLLRLMDNSGRISECAARIALCRTSKSPESARQTNGW